MKCKDYESENVGPYGFCKYLVLDEEAMSQKRLYKDRIYKHRFCEIKNMVILDHVYIHEMCFIGGG